MMIPFAYDGPRTSMLRSDHPPTGSRLLVAL
jgi:hypothetical protein